MKAIIKKSFLFVFMSSSFLSCNMDVSSLGGVMYLAKVRQNPGAFVVTSPYNDPKKDLAVLALSGRLGSKCILKFFPEGSSLCSAVLHLGSNMFCLPKENAWAKSYKISTYVGHAAVDSLSGTEFEKTISLAGHALWKGIYENGSTQDATADICEANTAVNNINNLVKELNTKMDLSKAQNLAQVTFAATNEGLYRCAFNLPETFSTNGLNSGCTNRVSEFSSHVCRKALYTYKKANAGALPPVTALASFEQRLTQNNLAPYNPTQLKKVSALLAFTNTEYKLQINDLVINYKSPTIAIYSGFPSVINWFETVFTNEDRSLIKALRGLNSAAKDAFQSSEAFINQGTNAQGARDIAVGEYTTVPFFNVADNYNGPDPMASFGTQLAALATSQLNLTLNSTLGANSLSAINTRNIDLDTIVAASSVSYSKVTNTRRFNSPAGTTITTTVGVFCPPAAIAFTSNTADLISTDNAFSGSTTSNGTYSAQLIGVTPISMNPNLLNLTTVPAGATINLGTGQIH